MKIIKIGTETCGPCKIQNKELDKLTDIEIVKINAEEDENAALEYNIRNIPTTIILDNDNKEIKRWSGLVKANEIQNYLNTLAN